MSRHASRKNVRLQDIADVLELSASTVSRALAGNRAINEDTRESVQKTALSLGYNAPMQGARRRRVATRTVGVVMSVTEMHNRFMTLLLEHVHQALLESGYHVMLIIDSMTDASQLSTFRPLIDGYLDGMIIASVTLDSLVVRELQRLGVPLVLVVRSMDGAEVDTVEADNVRGGAEAARHLYELGHRRIALVMGPANTSTSRDRAKGALDFLRSMGLPPEATPAMWNAYTSEAGYSGAVQLLAQSDPVTAILAGNDTIALGVLYAARYAGIEVPGRLSVVGFDDIPIAGSPLVRLTTIQHPVQEIARTAARRMVERIRNGALTPPLRDVLPTQLVRRDTTGPPPPV